MPDLQNIVACKIHPAIGIARLGNSPSEFFVGPEIPGVSAVPPGGFKDAGDPGRQIPRRVKRQAARFRVFGYDAAGEVVAELTSQDADIAWTVRLANMKAAWHQFNGSDGEAAPPASPLRNNGIDRDLLRIDSLEHTVNSQTPTVQLMGQLRVAAPPRDVPLGELRYEGAGTLLVLGGQGDSQTWNGSSIDDYANNDGWYDGTSDGPVSAVVVLRGGRALTVAPAWVIVAPPDFAPMIGNVVTLYDVALEVALRRGWIAPLAQPSFDREIQPLFSRAMALAWVKELALEGHGPGGPGDFNAAAWAQLADPATTARSVRQRLLGVVRNPNFAKTDPQAVTQARRNFMPPLSGDDGDTSTGRPGHWLTVTRTQFDWLQQWADGDFVPRGAPLDTTITAAGLDRAALEACAGGAFFPDIEATWIMRRSMLYAEPFRFDPHYLDEFVPGHPRLAAGDITKRSALPWQADFFECRNTWWPAQRPDEVLAADLFARVQALDAQLAALTPGTPAYQALAVRRDDAWRSRVPWARPFANDPAHPTGDLAMVQNWHRLGFVASADDAGAAFVSQGQPQFVEIDRDPTL